MFCKKCGSTIKDGAEYCPRCGQRVENPSSKAVIPPAPRPVVSGTLPQDPGIRTESGRSTGQKKLLFLIAGAAVLLILLFLIFRLASGGTGRTYTLTGTWYSDDAANVEKAIRRLLTQEAELPEWAVDMFLEVTGVDTLSDATVTFSEDGGLWFGGSGMSLSFGAFTYEKITDDTLLLKYSLSIPVIGDISASYQAKYTLKKDKLTLDLFGVTARFTRQE